MFNKIICITNDIICEKAQRVLINFNSFLPPFTRTHHKFSRGCLSRVKKRKKFRWFKSHAGSGDVHDTEIQEGLPILCAQCSVFNVRDRFYLDELGLCYRMTPCTTIGPE